MFQLLLLLMLMLLLQRMLLLMFMFLCLLFDGVKRELMEMLLLAALYVERPLSLELPPLPVLLPRVLVDSLVVWLLVVRVGVVQVMWLW